jgi:hypothetical protein
VDFEAFGPFDSDCPLSPTHSRIRVWIFDFIRCLPGRVDIGSQEQAETRIGDNTVPLRQGDSVGARCGVWSLGMLASMLTPSAVGMPFCADRSTDPTPGIQLGDRHHPVSPPDILGAAGARSSARHPRWLLHKPRCLTSDPVSMGLASTTNAWKLWRQPGYCCGLGLPFNDARSREPLSAVSNDPVGSIPSSSSHHNGASSSSSRHTS